MASNRDDVVSGYIRMRIREWQASGREIQELARVAGTAKSTPSQILMGTGVGAKSGPRFARAFGFANYDALKHAAFDWWKSQGAAGAAAVEQPESPGQAEAIRLVLELQQGSEAQLRTVLAAYSHPLFRERDRDWWVQTLLGELARDRQTAKDDAKLRAETNAGQKIVRSAHAKPERASSKPPARRRHTG